MTHNIFTNSNFFKTIILILAFFMIDKTFLLYNTISYNSHDNNTIT